MNQCLFDMTGYDMRFDIKYAYFNFLQSINYSSPSDPAFRMDHVESCSKVSACNPRVELDMIPSVQNGDTAEHYDDSEEE